MLRTDELMRTLSRADGMEKLSGYSFFPTAEANCSAFLQSMLAGRGMTPATLIERSLISRPYVYQMLSGERLPGRDIALRIAFSLALTLEETQQLLRGLARQTKRDLFLQGSASFRAALKRRRPLLPLKSACPRRGRAAPRSR